MPSFISPECEDCDEPAAELAAAVQMEDVRDEAADTAMCLFMVAEIAGFDLLQAVADKLAINEQRQWIVDAAGCLHHVKGSDPRESLAARSPDGERA